MLFTTEFENIYADRVAVIRSIGLFDDPDFVAGAAQIAGFPGFAAVGGFKNFAIPVDVPTSVFTDEINIVLLHGGEYEIWPNRTTCFKWSRKLIVFLP